MGQSWNGEGLKPKKMGIDTFLDKMLWFKFVFKLELFAWKTELLSWGQGTPHYLSSFIILQFLFFKHQPQCKEKHDQPMATVTKHDCKQKWKSDDGEQSWWKENRKTASQF